MCVCAPSLHKNYIYNQIAVAVRKDEQKQELIGFLQEICGKEIEETLQTETIN